MRTNAKRLAWLCTGLMALGLTACTPTKPGGTRPTTSRIHPVVVEASALARNHDSLVGPSRRDNAVAIDRLIAGLDNATLGIEAAKLAEGDPLYNFMGRELQRRGLDLPRPFDREGHWRFNAGNRPAADSGHDGHGPC